MALEHIWGLEYMEESPLARLPAVHGPEGDKLREAVMPAGPALQFFLFQPQAVAPVGRVFLAKASQAREQGDSPVARNRILSGF